MNLVISVFGEDKKGIIHRVSGACVKNNLNIIDINQTILTGYFSMIMIVQKGENSIIENIINDFKVIEDDMNVKIHVQNEEIFKAMHTI